MTATFENYPPLPEPSQDLDLFNSFTVEQMREAQRLMAKECAKLLDETLCAFGAYLIHERFGPFDD